MRQITKGQLTAIGTLALFSFLMRGIAFGDSQRLLGHKVDWNGVFAQYATFGHLFGDVQVLSFLVGCPLAVLPYQGIRYQEKAMTFSLTIALVLQLVFFTLGVIKLTFG